MVYGSKFGVNGLEIRNKSLGSGFTSFGLSVWGLGFRV
jgi:hypothetical protein